MNHGFVFLPQQPHFPMIIGFRVTLPQTAPMVVLVRSRCHPAVGLIRTLAKEKCFHLGCQVGLVFGIHQTQAPLINQQGLVNKPLLPCFFRDLLKDSLPEISRPRCKFEALSLSFKNDAVNCSTQNG